ncbi:hypothetical protein [Chitinophaga filiformis]|uniref:Lipoprotein n=1 Tax=Chitinophaga filiformis TaxID=104663 RepID=A0A1G7JNQ8_CHIFI|nr:hypothetical protein [Chitinophaga filiformis]SDF26600.1 hypothetical protein SAMN04488121_1011315 [Chitinophaga filiformis]
MKYIIAAFISACVISACQPSAPSTTTTTDSTATTATEERAPLEARIMGTYKGDFGGSPIYITINYCSGNKIAGYNTHKGLRRNVSGSITSKGDKLDIQLAEPGDHEFDGVFSLVMDTSLTKASGSWKPSNNKSLSEKQLALTRLKQDDDALGFMTGDHADINFDTDGSCVLNYYQKTGDSTFSAQMNTLRGTWEKQPNNEILVNWQPNPAYPQRSTVFTMVYQTPEGDGNQPYLERIKGDDFQFFPGEY